MRDEALSRGRQTPYHKPTREEVAERYAWRKRAEEENRRLDSVEPLPDNFIEICKGKAWPPVYST